MFKKLNHHWFFHNKTEKLIEPIQYYIGDYTFFDNKTNKQHTLTITAQSQIIIDNINLEGSVIGLTTLSLTFLDHYGYQLIVKRQDNQLTVYDEAEDQTYQLKPIN